MLITTIRSSWILTGIYQSHSWELRECQRKMSVPKTWNQWKMLSLLAECLQGGKFMKICRKQTILDRITEIIYSQFWIFIVRIVKLHFFISNFVILRFCKEFVIFRSCNTSFEEPTWFECSLKCIYALLHLKIKLNILYIYIVSSKLKFKYKIYFYKHHNQENYWQY